MFNMKFYILVPTCLCCVLHAIFRDFNYKVGIVVDFVLGAQSERFLRGKADGANGR